METIKPSQQNMKKKDIVVSYNKDIFVECCRDIWLTEASMLTS